MPFEKVPIYSFFCRELLWHWGFDF